MIESIRLVRFRGFEDVSLQLAPLTLVLGPNSAGKSSFAQSLVALDQVNRFGSGSGLPSLDRPAIQDEDWPADLGTLESLRTNGTTGDVGFEVCFKHASFRGNVYFGFGGWGAQGLQLSRITLSASHLGTTSMSQSGDGTSTSIPLTIRSSSEPIAASAFSRNLDLTRKDDTTWRNQDDALGLAYMKGLKLVSYVQSGATMMATEAITPGFVEILNKLRYLRTNRRDPFRISDRKRGDVDDRVGTLGQWTADALYANLTRLVECVPPPRTPSSRDEAGAILRDRVSPRKQELAHWVDVWLRHLGLANAVDVKEHPSQPGLHLTVQLRPGEPFRELPDVGFGISQVLPVIVQGLLVEKGGVFVVEQPESQLHPRPQGNLADFLLCLALSGRQVLVETHSEYLFHRLRLRSLLDLSLDDLVKVHFLDHSDVMLCEKPREVSLRDGGEVTWPRGFLSEGVDEELAIQYARAARKP